MDPWKRRFQVPCKFSTNLLMESPKFEKQLLESPGKSFSFHVICWSFLSGFIFIFWRGVELGVISWHHFMMDVLKLCGHPNPCLQTSFPADNLLNIYPPGSLTVRPWKYTGPQKEADRLPPIIFQGLLLLLLNFGCVNLSSCELNYQGGNNAQPPEKQSLRTH